MHVTAARWTRDIRRIVSRSRHPNEWRLRCSFRAGRPDTPRSRRLRDALDLRLVAREEVEPRGDEGHRIELLATHGGPADAGQPRVVGRSQHRKAESHALHADELRGL